MDETLYYFGVDVVVVVEVLVVEDVQGQVNSALLLQQLCEQDEKSQLVELHAVDLLLHRLRLSQHPVGAREQGVGRFEGQQLVLLDEVQH